MIYEWLNKPQTPDMLILSLNKVAARTEYKVLDLNGNLLQGVQVEIIRKVMSKVGGLGKNWLGYTDDVLNSSNNPDGFNSYNSGQYQDQVSQTNLEFRATYQGKKYVTTYKELSYSHSGYDNVEYYDYLIMERV